MATQSDASDGHDLRHEGLARGWTSAPPADVVRAVLADVVGLAGHGRSWFAGPQTAD